MSKTSHDKKRIRLAVVSDALLPWHTGGKEARYAQLLTALAEYGVDVSVYTMDWWSPAPHGQALPHHAIGKAHPLYIGEHRSMKQGVAFALACFKLLTKSGIDAIEADHMPYLQLYPLAIVAKIKRVPLVVTWHELWGKSGWSSYLPGYKCEIAYLIEKGALRLPTKIVSVSKNTTKRLMGAGVSADRVVTLLSGVDSLEISETTKSDEPFEILFAGRLIDHKRVDLILYALALLKQRGHSYRCIITGDGPAKTQLETLSKNLGITELATFAGRLPTSRDVWSLMRQAKVLAFPSEREGFGIAVAETLTAGTPVVTSDHPDNASKDLIESDSLGTIIPAGSAAALADALQHWVENPADPATVTATFQALNPALSVQELARSYAQMLFEVTK
jgi:glycosyltransferase involved in cell wall biosynthesis